MKAIIAALLLCFGTNWIYYALELKEPLLFALGSMAYTLACLALRSKE